MATETAALSVAAYLEQERSREEKHEYENGELIPMGGGMKEHNKIVRNLLTLIWAILQAAGHYEVYAADMRVHTPLRNRFYYPDVVVTKGKEEYLDNTFDTLLNPMVIVEVLSSSTEARDRVVKFEAYRSVDSLKEYVIVAQDDYRVEGFYKNEEGEWIIRELAAGKDNTFAFHSIEVELNLSDIYDRVGI